MNIPDNLPNNPAAAYRKGFHDGKRSAMAGDASQGGGSGTISAGSLAEVARLSGGSLAKHGTPAGTGQPKGMIVRAIAQRRTNALRRIRAIVFAGIAFFIAAFSVLLLLTGGKLGPAKTAVWGDWSIGWTFDGTFSAFLDDTYPITDSGSLESLNAERAWWDHHTRLSSHALLGFEWRKQSELDAPNSAGAGVAWAHTIDTAVLPAWILIVGAVAIGILFARIARWPGRGYCDGCGYKLGNRLTCPACRSPVKFPPGGYKFWRF